jgi:hypothetical protein
VPHYFKTVYIPDDKFLLIGGLERETSQTSARCFILDDKGKLTGQKDLTIPRQYFTIAPDYANEKIYAIGGYNDELGLLASFETFSTRARKWTVSEETQQLNKPRINAAACKCGSKYIYLFGGMGEDNEFLDSIERYNSELGIWTVLTVKLPQKVTNHYAFSFNPQYIIILGGMVKKDAAYLPKES